jgi:phosphoglycerate dehydrogenase-like enzyme
MIEILITTPLSDDLTNRLRGISPQFHITVYSAKKVEEIPSDTWTKTEILLTDQVIPQPNKAPSLKWIQFISSGIDRWLDEPIVTKPEMQITTLSGSMASQMAEHAVMMMLALGHKLPALYASQRKSEWPKDRMEKFLPFELRGATVGIVGYGSVGRQIACLLGPFDVTILATKRDAKSPEDKGYIPEGLGDPEGNLVYRLYPGEALKSMLKFCDFIIVCVPLTKMTKGLINASAFSSIKTGAFLIDISRGKVVDQNALFKSLQDGKLAGAALDVFPEEPLPMDNPLWAMNNVIITPHIAGNSAKLDLQAYELFSENLHRYLAGLPLFNLYNPDLGY